MPEAQTLEGRSLLTVAGGLASIAVSPALLPPTPNGRPLPVQFFGTLASNRPQTPAGLFFVTDEFRAYEPQGKVSLTPLGKTNGWYRYGFNFSLKFPTNGSTNTPDGRHYNIFIGGKDNDGTDGKTVRVLVPKSPPPRPRWPVGPAALGPRLAARMALRGR